MSVTITIKTASLISDIKIKSHMNTERIKDGADRYAVRAGEENQNELLQNLQDAYGELLSICRRCLSQTEGTSGSDQFDSSTTDKSITFDFKEQMPSDVLKALAEAIHEYLLSGTLKRFYTSAAMAELANVYAAQETASHARIRELIYYRPMPSL